jgi:hypothetical protein
MRTYKRLRIRRKNSTIKRGGMPNKNRFEDFVYQTIFNIIGTQRENISSVYESSLKMVDEIKQKYLEILQMYDNDIKIDKFNVEAYNKILDEIFDLNNEIYQNVTLLMFSGNGFDDIIYSDDYEYVKDKIMNFFELYSDNPLIDTLYEKGIESENGSVFLPK